MIVVDASIVVEMLLHTSAGDRAATLLLAPDAGLNAPHLIDIEVAHAVRRLAANGKITNERGQDMLLLLTDLPIRRHAHLWFLPRIWALRANMTAYDASYVALAEALGAPLFTQDRHLARAAAHLIEIDMA